MEILKSEKLSPTDAFARFLDSWRVSLLRLSLKPNLFRHLYGVTHWRLGAGMIVSTLFYLPIAFLKPDYLLAFGPLIFGYPHLVASYRFTTSQKRYHLFVLMTVVAIALHVSKVGFAGIEQLPFGVWQIVVATLAFIISRFISKSVSFIEITASVFICAGLVRLAWLEPIMYVGGALIVHNWVAFIYWIKASKEKARRMTAILSTLLFLLIHILVLGGYLDSWIPIKDGIVQFADGSQTTGWYLASWTNDALVWYRLLVLYAFGLSIHYFVWLRAIPESLNNFEHPNSFRLILKNLRQDLGIKTLILSALVIIAGLIVWLLSFPLGSKIYFEIAILHGSIELIFLFARANALNDSSSIKTT